MRKETKLCSRELILKSPMTMGLFGEMADGKSWTGPQGLEYLVTSESEKVIKVFWGHVKN